MERAREDYARLKSGVVTVTNLGNGEVEQILTFKYDEVGILLYSLTGETDGKPYSQYCNGYETYTLENGELRVVKKESVEYDAYTYDVRYPMTDEDYIYFSPNGVESASKTEYDGGGCSYEYTYDPSVIGGEGGLGKLEGFTVRFDFDENGELEFFEEHSAYERNGEKTEYSYRIEISERNSVGKIEMPEDIEKMS